ncbi:MAG: NlpC/P60 family protein [Saprospiraceae bacterium]
MKIILTCFFPFLLLIILFSCNHAESPFLQKAKNEIQKIQQKYVKDKRTALFNVTVKAGAKKSIVLSGETIFPQAKEELLGILISDKIKLIDSISILPATQLNGKNYGVVNLSVCNIRSNPKHSAELATQAILGTPLKVYKKEGDFYYVQTPDNYLGWVDDGGLTLMDELEYNNWKKAKKAVCLVDYIFAYELPDNKSRKVTDLLAGNILEIIDQQNYFTKISLPDGRIGFVENEYLMPYENWIDSRQPSSENIIATAQEMIGRPYLWGGTSGKGMDCSGFTKTVFYLNGIQLERDASLQVHNGEAIETDTSLNNLLPGDLLFFGKYREDGSERITHVAIYMGDGKIIHASDRVKIESLKRGDPDFSEYRLKSFMKAKRIIGSEGKNGIVTLKDSPDY